MSRIVFAWELGMGSGHVLGFLPVAQELRKRGHEITFIFKDLSRAEAMLGKTAFRYLQAPMWLPKIAIQKPILNYADILARHGFLDQAGLQGLINAWRNLFDLLKPELLIMDHAPTALLASKGLGIPRTLIGTGFFSPPKKYPIPSFRSWQTIDERSLIMSEQSVLSVINKVIENNGDKNKLNQLSELFEVDEDFLCTFKELDHYKNREASEYWGPRFSLSFGHDPVWPMGDGKRVFVYLYLQYPGFEAVIKSLDTLDISAIVFVPEIPRELINRYQTARISIVSEAVNMEKVREQCDFCLCHGGHGTVVAMLLAAKPLLMFPLHAEQKIVSLNVEKIGAGLFIDTNEKKISVKKPLTRLLDENSFSKNAKIFSDRYNNFSPEIQTNKISIRCESLMHI